MKITQADKHNLLDLYYMEFDYNTIEANGMMEWFVDFFGRLEDELIKEETDSR